MEINKFAATIKIEFRWKKNETVSVEEFISCLTFHIPDEQFKTIYGMYSRRTKNLCKKGKKKEKNISLSQSKKQSVSYVCLACHEIEAIPLSVVKDFNLMDAGDSTTLLCLHVKTVEDKCIQSITGE